MLVGADYPNLKQTSLSERCAKKNLTFQMATAAVSPAIDASIVDNMEKLVNRLKTMTPDRVETMRAWLTTGQGLQSYTEFLSYYLWQLSQLPPPPVPGEIPRSKSKDVVGILDDFVKQLRALQATPNPEFADELQAWVDPDSGAQEGEAKYANGALILYIPELLDYLETVEAAAPKVPRAAGIPMRVVPSPAKARRETKASFPIKVPVAAKATFPIKVPVAAKAPASVRVSAGAAPPPAKAAFPIKAPIAAKAAAKVPTFVAAPPPAAGSVGGPPALPTHPPPPPPVFVPGISGGFTAARPLSPRPPPSMLGGGGGGAAAAAAAGHPFAPRFAPGMVSAAPPPIVGGVAAGAAAAPPSIWGERYAHELPISVLPAPGSTPDSSIYYALVGATALDSTPVVRAVGTNPYAFPTLYLADQRLYRLREALTLGVFSESKDPSVPWGVSSDRAAIRKFVEGTPVSTTLYALVVHHPDSAAPGATVYTYVVGPNQELLLDYVYMYFASSKSRVYYAQMWRLNGTLAVDYVTTVSEGRRQYVVRYPVSMKRHELIMDTAAVKARVPGLATLPPTVPSSLGQCQRWDAFFAKYTLEKAGLPRQRGMSVNITQKSSSARYLLELSCADNSIIRATIAGVASRLQPTLPAMSVLQACAVLEYDRLEPLLVNMEGDELISPTPIQRGIVQINQCDSNLVLGMIMDPVDYTLEQIVSSNWVEAIIHPFHLLQLYYTLYSMYDSGLSFTEFSPANVGVVNLATDTKLTVCGRTHVQPRGYALRLTNYENLQWKDPRTQVHITHADLVIALTQLDAKSDGLVDQLSDAALLTWVALTSPESPTDPMVTIASVFQHITNVAITDPTCVARYGAALGALIPMWGRFTPLPAPSVATAAARLAQITATVATAPPGVAAFAVDYLRSTGSTNPLNTPAEQQDALMLSTAMLSTTTYATQAYYRRIGTVSPERITALGTGALV